MPEPVWAVRRHNGRLIARARGPQDVIELEGNYYFHPDCVERDVLRVTERTYTCPYKGTCRWVDLVDGPVAVPDCAWVYPEPKPGHRRIAGWFGFYPQHAHYRVQRES